MEGNNGIRIFVHVDLGDIDSRVGIGIVIDFDDSMTIFSYPLKDLYGDCESTMTALVSALHYMIRYKSLHPTLSVFTNSNALLILLRSGVEPEFGSPFAELVELLKCYESVDLYNSEQYNEHPGVLSSRHYARIAVDRYNTLSTDKSYNENLKIHGIRQIRVISDDNE